MTERSGTTLSEIESKALLAAHGVPFAPEITCSTVDDAIAAADRMGGRVAVKLNGAGIAHKTERGLVRLDLASPDAVAGAASELLAAARPEDGAVSLLVAPMLPRTRELIAGLARDPQFGMTVMVGIGGVLAEVIADVAIRLVPLEPVDAVEMIDELRMQAVLGPFRGQPAVDRDALADVLLCLSAAAAAHPELEAADVNPLLVVDGRPVGVDALVQVAVAAEPQVTA